MSGETEANESGWTTDTLRYDIQKQIDNLKETAAERAETHRRENDDRDRLLVQIMDERRDAQQAEFQRYASSTAEAINKAEEGTTRRFDAVNEFRAQLADQSSTFLPRQEYTTAHGALETRLGELQDRLNRSEGKGMGLNAGWLYVLGGLSALGTLVTLITLLTHLTGA